MSALIYKDRLLVHGPEAAALNDLGVGDVIDYKGKSITVVPHNEAACRVLWNACRLRVSAPIEQTFAFPGPFRPMPHQRATAGFMTVHDRCFNLLDMGLGKTASCVWAAEYLLSKGRAKKILVIAPLSCLRTVWETEIFTLTPTRRVAVVHGSKVKRKAALETDADYYVINHDGIKLEESALIKMGFDLVIVDEFTAFKTWNAARSKVAQRITKNVGRLWMLSATPTPQSPEDAYFPTKITSPSNVTTLTRFRARTMMQVNEHKWVPRADAVEYVGQVMQPSIRYEKTDVLKDLPAVMPPLRLEAQLTKDQKRALRELEKERVVMLGEGDKVAVRNAASVALKMLQICQGIVIDEQSDVRQLDRAGRSRTLLEALSYRKGKALAFGAFRGVVENMAKDVADDLGKDAVAMIHGGTGATRREEIFKEFQDPTSKLQVIVAHPGTMSHGLTLTQADMIVWNGPAPSREVFLQANHRINRPGQKRVMQSVHIGSNFYEWKLFRVHQDGLDLQQTLLDLFKGKPLTS